MGNYTNVIPYEYMTNLSNNVLQYMSLVKQLSGNSDYDIGFIEMLSGNTSSGIARMANDYDKLANSVKNLSNSLQSLDIEKMTALKTLSSNIVLMSLMDPDQFEEMMDALDEKTEVFVDFIKNIEEGTAGRELTIKTFSRKDQSGATMNDLLNAMNVMNNRLAVIASSSDNISSYVNEIRGGHKVNVKKR